MNKKNIQTIIYIRIPPPQKKRIVFLVMIDAYIR